MLAGQPHLLRLLTHSEVRRTSNKKLDMRTVSHINSYIECFPYALLGGLPG